MLEHGENVGKLPLLRKMSIHFSLMVEARRELSRKIHRGVMGNRIC